MITREEIIVYVKGKYKIEPDYPWARTPNYAVLRHPDSRKWFGVIVDVLENKLGLKGDKRVDALNVKCGPLLTGSLRSQPGILPAYHMSKEHWLTILLSSSIPQEEVYGLIDLSYMLTK